jgi:hypothetical protein
VSDRELTGWDDVTMASTPHVYISAWAELTNDSAQGDIYDGIVPGSPHLHTDACTSQGPPAYPCTVNISSHGGRRA